MCEVGLGIGGFEIMCPFGSVLGVRRSGFDLGPGSRCGILDASGSQTYLRVHLLNLFKPRVSARDSGGLAWIADCPSGYWAVCEVEL